MADPVKRSRLGDLVGREGVAPVGEVQVTGEDHRAALAALATRS